MPTFLRSLSSDRYRDAGLLVLRVGLGGAMVVHGWPKLMGGPALWTKLGGAMGTFGIHFAPALWGASAAIAEAVGGLLLVIGLGTRPAAAALAFTMFVAASSHVADGDSFAMGWSHAFEDGVAFVALAVMGGGKYALERRI